MSRSRIHRPGFVSNDKGRLHKPINRQEHPSIHQVVTRHLNRRQFLQGALGAAALASFGTTLAAHSRRAQAAASAPSSSFQELQRITDETDHLAPGYARQILIRWGDPVLPSAPPFSPQNQTAAAAEQQFGQNNDFTAYIPFPFGSNSSEHGLLVVNHEYPNPQLMWSGLTEDEAGKLMDEEQVNVTMAVSGLSVLEIQKVGGSWTVVADSPFNRRISMSTPIRLSGPAAGHDLMKTRDDSTGKLVIGTHDNCNGGITPWGTILSGEEGSGSYFAGDYSQTPDPDHLARYYYDDDENDYYGWGRFYERFQLGQEPNEPNRFEWVVEVDPFDPNSMPVKRTALGRFAHEGAHTILNKDGRVVVYLGDDWEFEYIYKFVTAGTYDAGDRTANLDLLDEGTLYVARFNDDGTLDWLPLIFGEAPLTPENGFRDQGEVMIKTRQAADLLGATPMDAPEGYAPNPVTGRVYVALTENEDRTPDQVNAANPRPENVDGHILELIPPGGEGAAADHTATRYTWSIFIACGDPDNPEAGAFYHADTSKDGWFTDPDNIGFDQAGRLWVCTDGPPDAGFNDALYVMDTMGEARALPKLFYSPPIGSEVCSPCFTPDGKTLFISVQHPGEDSDTLDEVSTRWPDFDANTPPRPSVVVITRDDGGEIGA